MQCIALSAPQGKDSWHIHRSVETLAYHRSVPRVEILFVFLAENLLANNSIDLLHRDRVRCRIVPSWPLPRHEDERSDTETAVLQQVYGGLFREENACLWQTGRLTPWDEAQEVKPAVLVRDWANAERLLSGSECWKLWDAQYPDNGKTQPFTCWRLCPFTERGHYLIAFRLSVEWSHYKRFPSPDSVFTVDGPDRLLRRILYEDIAGVPDAERDTWVSRLAPFENETKRLHPDNYDVILLRSSSVDVVERIADYGTTGIYEAPQQPNSNGTRFITSKPSFTLPLCFSELSSAEQRTGVTPIAVAS
jgi:hypothetical protein